MTNPIIAAIDSGHYQYTVTPDMIGRRSEMKAGELRCRTDHELMPCRALLAARKEAGPPQAGQSKIANTPTFLPPKPFGR